MTDKTMRRFGRAPTLAATPLAAALLVLLCAMSAEAGWWENGLQKGGKMWVKDKVESYVKPNPNAVRPLIGRLLGILNNASGGEGDWDAVKESMGQFTKDALPPVKLALYLREAVLNAPENLKDMLKSAERKIGSFVGRTGEAAVDPLAALAFPSKSDREYASKAGLLDKKPFSTPTVRVAAAPTAAARSPDPWSATGDGAADNAAVTHVWDEKGTGVVALPADWRDRRDPWGAAPTAAARSPDPWGATGGAADSPAVEYVWDEKGTGRVALPADWRDPKGTAAAAADMGDAYAVAGGGGARDGYAAALADTLGDDPAVAAGDDYQGALGALEAREAERRRLAEQRRREEAERRQAEAARAERLKREREAREREERRLAELEERRIREQTARNNAAAWNAVIGSLTGLSASLAGMATGSGLSTGYMQMPQIQQQMPAYATAGSGSCDGQVNRQVQAALQQIMQRGQSSNAARTKYCAMANTAWAAIWGAEQCLNDPEYSSRRNEIRAEISNSRRRAQHANRVATQMGSKGCDCWTNICSR